MSLLESVVGIEDVEDLKCCICFDLLLNPCQCQHGHTFCRDCICKTMKDGGTLCPICRVRIRIESLTRCLYAQKHIENLKFHCRYYFSQDEEDIPDSPEPTPRSNTTVGSLPMWIVPLSFNQTRSSLPFGIPSSPMSGSPNSPYFSPPSSGMLCSPSSSPQTYLQSSTDSSPTRARSYSSSLKVDPDGCPEVLSLKGKESHENNCEFRFKKCPFSNECPLIRAHEYLNHLKTCNSRPLQCEHCGEFFKNLEEHKSVCPLNMTTCEDCEQEIFLGDLQTHKRSDCPDTLISCPYQEQGCKSMVKRKDIPVHLKENSHDHLSLVVSTLTKKIENMKVQQEERDQTYHNDNALLSRMVKDLHSREEKSQFVWTIRGIYECSILKPSTSKTFTISGIDWSLSLWPENTEPIPYYFLSLICESSNLEFRALLSLKILLTNSSQNLFREYSIEVDSELFETPFRTKPRPVAPIQEVRKKFVDPKDNLVVHIEFCFQHIQWLI